MIKNTFTACDRSGMPFEHAQCFQNIADFNNTIIASRSVGKWATGLIRESYTSKGFHVKAKSCNWGPMAGFVMADPRFSKKGTSHAAIADQAGKIQTAIEHGAQTTPLYISEHRRQALQHAPFASIQEIPNLTRPGLYHYRAQVPSGDTMEFVLEQDSNCPPNTWRVCYGPNETPMGPGTFEGRRNRFENPDAHTPVVALTNPGTNPRLYKSALTGDYDLWGIYPRQHDYAPDGVDARPVVGSNYSVRPGPAWAQEDPNLGNITPRVNFLREQLNSAIRATGYFGGDMVHHSDELGRPYVDEVELEFIAFFPGETGTARFITCMAEFQIFVADARRKGFQDIYNPCWRHFHTYNRVLDSIQANRTLAGVSARYH